MTSSDLESGPSDVESAPTPREDFHRLADTGDQRLRVLQLPRPYRRVAEALVTRLRKSAGYPEARDALDEAATAASHLAEFVSRLRADLAEQQERRSRAEPFGEVWQDWAATKVATAREKAAQTWMQYYAEAFAAGQFGTCTWLCENVDLPGALLLTRRMLLSARAARDGAAGSDLAASLPALETLTDGDYAEAPGPERRFQLWCMRIRAVARGLRDPVRGCDLARRALTGAESRDPGLPPEVTAALHTALGECLLASDDRDAAIQEAITALRLAPGEPAGHVLRGLIAESTGDFVAADEHYEDAVGAGDARAVAGELFAPAPANLLWKYGRQTCDDKPEVAVLVIRRALIAGIRGEDEYPERKAYVDLARALEKSRGTEPRPNDTEPRPQGTGSEANHPAPARIDLECAEAYWEAGRRYAWFGDEINAESYLTRACSLDPSNGRYVFDLAETLRMHAVREDGTVDQRLLDQAAAAWERGYQLQVPGADVSWAYATMAVISHDRSGDLYRPRASWRAVALLERGLLRDPGNTRLKAQLSQAHRLLGHRRTALDLTSPAYRANPDDDLVFDQHFLALRELGKNDEALELARRRQRSDDQPWLVDRKVQVLVALGRFNDAIGLLESTPLGDEMLYYLQLGLCLELLNYADAARYCYEQVCGRSREATSERREDLYAWGCYLTGHYDDAERVYSDLVERDPEEAALRCDYGQILLARGDRDKGDVRRGRQQFLAGVEATRSMVALLFLEQVELPRLRNRADWADGSPRDPDVDAALEEISSALAGRHRLLERAKRAADELGNPVAATDADTGQAVQLGLARMEVAGGADEKALDSYVALTASGVPEARDGVSRAAGRMRTMAAAQARVGDLAGALAGFQRLAGRLERITEPPAELTATTYLRAALTALELDQRAEFAGQLARAFASGWLDSVTSGLRETAAELYDRPGQYWAVVDAARSLRAADGEESDAGGEAATAAGRLLDMLDPTPLLRASQEEVPATQVFPLVTPLTIRLGTGLLTPGRQADPELLAALKQMRKQVKGSTGVKIPQVDLRSLPPEAELGGYEVELYERRLAGGTVPAGKYFVLNGADQSGSGRAGLVGAGADGTAPDRGVPAVDAMTSLSDPLTGQPGHWSPVPPDPSPRGHWTAGQFVVRHLEAMIRTHLPRLFSIDDVGLWLSSVPQKSSGGGDVDRLSRADRLEVLRLLRLLLREQVPILDAGEIFALVKAAAPGWSALNLLPEVRQRLRSWLAPPAVLAAPPARLPPHLEEGLAAGRLPGDPASWELPRVGVPQLTDSLVAWYRDNAGDGPVVVRDPGLRPFLWRLLVEFVPGPVWVLTEEEVYGPP